MSEINELYEHLLFCDGILINESEWFYEVELKNKLNLIIRKKPSSDLDVFYQVFIRQDFYEVINVYKKYLFSNTVVRILDAGANVGYASAYFHSYFDKVSIIAVEPDGQNFALLSRNLEYNSINASLIKGGIWNRKANLNTVHDFRDRSDWAVRVEETNVPTDLKAFTINEILHKTKWNSIDILKIDIEGSEKQLFSLGSDLSFLKKTKCIAIEIHDEFDCREEINQILTDHHFELTEIGELTIGINKKHHNEQKPPNISVVMAVYNGLPYIPEAIESILNQTYTDFEFIIVNDGSTDDSLDIIQSYAERDKRIRILHYKENLGQTISLNKGILSARGKYIARMDADDISLPKRFEKQVRYLSQNPDVDMCGTAFRELINKEFGEIIVLPKSHSEIAGDILFYCPFIHSSVMFRREPFIKKGLLYDPCYKAAQDYDLWARAFNKVKLANIEECLIYYRLHENQMIESEKEAILNDTKHVITNLLSQMGVQFSKQELDLHLNIYWLKLQKTTEFRDSAFKWLMKLKLVNNETNYFPIDNFNKVISSYIQKLNDAVEPLVSVIISFVNSKQFLSETIESVLAQTYTNWELLLVDGGSTDGSDQIAMNYASKYPDKVCYLYQEGIQNMGASTSRNHGLKYSRGDIIQYLDSGNVLLPLKLKSNVEILMEKPEIDAVVEESMFWYSWPGKIENEESLRLKAVLNVIFNSRSWKLINFYRKARKQWHQSGLKYKNMFKAFFKKGLSLIRKILKLLRI